MAEERVQKILARAGYGSRRASEELITAGRVKINGKVAVLGSKADPQRDSIQIDNQQIAKQQPPVYIAVNKPQGVLSEVSPEEARQTVRDLVPVPGHMFIVGRLDMESEGLILLTNDGDLANRLSHPRYGHEKEYRVLVGTRPDSRQLDAWKYGVVLEDGYRTAPAKVRVDSLAGKGAWLQVILREGRKRQIREMGRQTGLPVLRILRIRIGSLLLGDLKPGAWRELRGDEIRALKVNKTYRETALRSPRAPRQGNRPDWPQAENGDEGRNVDRREASHDAPREGSRPERYRPASRPAGTRSEGSRPPGSRPAGSRSRPAGSRPAGSRPPGSRPSGSHAEGSPPSGSRPEGSRPAPRKPRGETTRTGRGGSRRNNRGQS